MSVESTRAVMSPYFASDHSDVSMMADDVVFTIMATGEEHRTPEGVMAMLHYFYQVAFDADAVPTNLVFSDGHAVWEGTFQGRHTGEFAGIPATGKEVEVPLCVVYDVAGGKIRRGRVYLEMPALFAQLGLS